jgi:hypothetical protein
VRGTRLSRSQGPRPGKDTGPARAQEKEGAPTEAVREPPAYEQGGYAGGGHGREGDAQRSRT